MLFVTCEIIKATMTKKYSCRWNLECLHACGHRLKYSNVLCVHAFNEGLVERAVQMRSRKSPGEVESHSSTSVEAQTQKWKPVFSRHCVVPSKVMITSCMKRRLKVAMCQRICFCIQYFSTKSTGSMKTSECQCVFQ